MLTTWEHKTYRIEWCVMHVEVDQYGIEQGTLDTFPFATKGEAERFRPEVAEQHKYVKGRWIPKDAKHTYVETIIRRRETLVHTEWK